MASGVKFPSPVGGVPFNVDFAPSVLFASLYACLVIVGIFRLARPSTRTLVSAGTFIFVVERVAAFSLRAQHAKLPPGDIDRHLLNYWQVTFATGYVSLWTNALRMLQSLVVNTTMGDTRRASDDSEANPGSGTPHPSSPDTKEGPGILQSGSRALNHVEVAELENAPEKVFVVEATKDDAEKGNVEVEEVSDPVSALPPLGNDSSGSTRLVEDLPKTRALYRRWFGILAVLGLVVIILGIAWGNDYDKTQRDAGKAVSVRNLRYATNAIGIIVVCALQGIAFWAFFCLPGIARKDAALIMCGIGALLNIVAIYRFVVLGDTTTDLLSTGPGSLNTTRDKILFYVLHAAPEFHAAAILMSIDVRRIYGTGLWGDRLSDPKPKA